MIDWIKKLFIKTSEIAKIYTFIFIIVMFLNQLLFFGLCLNPICLVAAMPHVLLITILVGTWYYKPTYKKIKKTLKHVRENYDEVKSTIEANKKNKEERNLFTGDIYLFVTQSYSKGEDDFKIILKRYQKANIISTIRLNNQYREKSLLYAINSIRDEFKAGDIIVIVRGGGDTTNWQFDTYKDFDTCREIKNLSDLFGVITISGIGHASDNFPIEKAVNFAQITPTDAAMQVAFLLDNKKW